MSRNRNAVWFVAATLGLLYGFAGGAQAAEPGKDHPMFSRYPGSEIIEHRQQEFAQTQFATGFVDKNAPAKPTQRTVEGRTTTIIYQLIGPYSALQVFRNYEQALGRAGLKPLLSCFNAACGGPQLAISLFRDSDRQPLYRSMLYDSMSTDNADFGYVSASGTANGAPLYASVFVGRIRTGSRVYVGLDIVEVEAMKTGQIVVDLNKTVVDLNKLTQDLREQGKVILSGIYFDTDKDIVKPESSQALQAISDYLKKNPQQGFFVVGHSDTAGSYEHNVDLSQRRAQAVVTTLTSKYAVAKPRLTAVGVGPVAPAGTNANDAGRALNRRVELVLR